MTRALQSCCNLITRLLADYFIIVIASPCYSMSAKTKKIATDRGNRHERETERMFYSASKVVDMLSLSFYDQQTLRQRKKIICDTYDDGVNTFTPGRNQHKHSSYSRQKISKPKTPVLRVKPDGINAYRSFKIQVTRDKKPGREVAVRFNKQESQPKSKSRPRKKSSSISSKDSRSTANKQIMRYISSRVDTSARGWNTLKTLMKDKAKKP